MRELTSFLHPRYALPIGATSARVAVQQLEDRAMPSGTEWLLRLEGLTGATTAEQMQEAEALIAAAQIEDVEIEVVDHATIDGNIVIETPERTPRAVLEERLQALPGFIDVQPFVGEEEEEAPNNLESGGGEFEPEATEGPVGPGPNLSVGLSGNEPTIAVNPLNPNNVVIAQFNNGQQTMKISLDGGATFPITRNAVLPSGQTFFQGDDSLAFDAQGRLFWSYLSGGSPSGPNVDVLQINPTTGAVVGSPTIVATSNLDKEWIAADKNPASPFHDNLYVIWHDQPGRHLDDSRWQPVGRRPGFHVALRGDGRPERRRLGRLAHEHRQHQRRSPDAPVHRRRRDVRPRDHSVSGRDRGHHDELRDRPGQQDHRLARLAARLDAAAHTG
jgi:hypothetical protein